MNDNINEDLGYRMMRTRNLTGKISQQMMSEYIGVSYQAIQRYEAGERTIPAEIVWAYSKRLKTSVSEFFGETDTDAKMRVGRMELRLAHDIMALPDASVRKSIYDLVQSIQKSADNQDNSPS